MSWRWPRSAPRARATVNRDGEEPPVIVGTPIAGETIDGEVFDGKRKTAIFPGDLPEKPISISVRAGPCQRCRRCRRSTSSGSGRPRSRRPGAGLETVAAAHPARPRAAVPVRRPTGMSKDPRKPQSFTFDEPEPVEIEPEDAQAGRLRCRRDADARGARPFLGARPRPRPCSPAPRKRGLPLLADHSWARSARPLRRLRPLARRPDPRPVHAAADWLGVCRGRVSALGVSRASRHGGPGMARHAAASPRCRR